MPKWTHEELLEIARRRRVLGGADMLSDEQIMQIMDPGKEKLSTADNTALPTGTAADEPLVAAVLLGGVEPATRFLQQGAKADQRLDKDGATLLMRAIETHVRNGVRMESVIGCVQALLEHGADPNLVDADGRTALHRAFTAQLPLAQDLLLAAGAVPKRCAQGKCQKCILSSKIAMRRKPAAESVLVKEPARRAAEAKRAAEVERGTFEQVLHEEFGDGDFATLAQMVLVDDGANANADAEDTKHAQSAAGRPAQSDASSPAAAGRRKKKKKKKKAERKGEAAEGEEAEAEAAELEEAEEAAAEGEEAEGEAAEGEAAEEQAEALEAEGGVAVLGTVLRASARRGEGSPL